MSAGATGSHAGSGAVGSGAVGTRQPRSVLVPVGAFVAWTLFVWIGRIRNVTADAALSGADRWGPLAMSIVFVIGAVVVAALAYRDHVVASASSAGALRDAVWVVAGYTTVVWVVRAGDIALGGGHEPAFVVVHVVLAAASIALGAWASEACRRRSAHITSVKA